MDLSIIIPTYNEKANLHVLLNSLFSILKKNKIFGEIIVVDDNSPDNTGDIAEMLKKKYKNLMVIHRAGKLGLSSAAIAGFNIAHGKILCLMDADLSHPAEKIPAMFKIVSENRADLVIGSRYVPGGKIIGWGMYRKTLSKGAVLLSRIVTNVRDPMSGFFMVRKSLLDMPSLNSKGFKILLEIIVKSKLQRIVEVPITFINRKEGKSKAGFGEIFFYLHNLLGYLASKNVQSNK